MMKEENITVTPINFTRAIIFTTLEPTQKDSHKGSVFPRGRCASHFLCLSAGPWEASKPLLGLETYETLTSDFTCRENGADAC